MDKGKANDKINMWGQRIISMQLQGKTQATWESMNRQPTRTAMLQCTGKNNKMP